MGAGDSCRCSRLRTSPRPKIRNCSKVYRLTSYHQLFSLQFEPTQFAELFYAFNLEVDMFTNQPVPFVHKVHPENGTITMSRCPQCGVLVGAGTVAKYLAIAEAVHKCRLMDWPHLKPEDMRRLC